MNYNLSPFSPNGDHAKQQHGPLQVFFLITAAQANLSARSFPYTPAWPRTEMKTIREKIDCI
jgi:hypothetical protein